jgi:hypothetical protein
VERYPPGDPSGFCPDFVVKRETARSFLLLGDPGEADPSQYAVVHPLLRIHQCGRDTDFMVIVSDVIYPAGDVNDYVNAFYLPYENYRQPIFGIPGNHDWYDGLNGFMFHFCHSEPLEDVTYRASAYSLKARLARLLWRGATPPKREILGRYRDARPPYGRDEQDRERPIPVQPAPYFAIDMGVLLLVAIDTGIDGTLDADQGRWLLRMSRRSGPKVLITGKPIYVDGQYHPGHIAWDEYDDENRRRTVDDIVRDPSHGYVAVIGGDIHNYQRYPVRVKALGRDERLIQYVVSGGGGAYLKATHLIPPVGYAADEEPPFGKRALPGKGGLRGCGSDVVVPPREDEFRCYPLRGDSLAYFARNFGPILVAITGALMVAAAGALASIAFLPDPPWVAVASSLGGLGLTVLALVGGAWLARWATGKAGHRRKAPRFGGTIAFFVPVAALFAWLAVLLRIDESRDVVAVLVALATPLAVIAIPLVLFETRIARLRGTGEVALALAAVAIPSIVVLKTDWDTSVKLGVLAGAALVVVLLAVGVGMLRARATDHHGEVSTPFSLDYTALLLVLLGGVVATLVVDEDPWVLWMILTVAATVAVITFFNEHGLQRWGLAWAFFIALAAIVAFPLVFPAGMERAIGAGLVAIPAGVLVWSAFMERRHLASLPYRYLLMLLAAAVAMPHFAVDSWVWHVLMYVPFVAAASYLLWSSECPRAGPIVLPRFGAPSTRQTTVLKLLKVAVAVALFAVVASLLALPGDDVLEAFALALAILVIAAALLALASAVPAELWQCSNALLGRKLEARDAAAFLASRFAEDSDSEVSVTPVRYADASGPDGDMKLLAAAFYPANPDKRSGVGDAWRSFISEISSTDHPPFFKSFLRVDVDKEKVLKVRCFGVTGYENETRLPTLEDCFEIDLKDA